MEETTITGEIITEQAPEGKNEENQSNITVIDSVMGSGKTSYIIQYMNENPEKAFVYCTPFLDEIERIRGRKNKEGEWELFPSCPHLHFAEPTFFKGRKIDDFNKLLFERRNITVTHATFANATEETIQNIKEGEYILILDETLNTLVDFNEICTGQKLRKGDISLLLANGYISVDPETSVVTWLDKECKETRYEDVERMAKNGSLLLINHTLLYWEFPHTIFKLFKEVYILTYLFEGSVMSSYLKSHDITWTKRSVCIDSVDEWGNKHFSLTDYTQSLDKIAEFRNLVTIFQNDIMNAYTGNSLSKTWFLKYAKSEDIDQLQNNLINFFRNRMKAKPKDILWTTLKDYKDKLKGKGYTRTRRMTEQERMKPQAEREKIEARLSCFLPCNSRATNQYGERSVLAYVLNVYPTPHVTDYLSKRNSPLDRNKYALCQMIQWIWRSRIRNGEPIVIYIPSCRMRKFFNEWLQGGVTGD